MDDKQFEIWLKNTTKLKNVTCEKYSRAIHTINKDIKNWGITSFDIFKVEDIGEIDKVMELPEFIEKNRRGNNMYSVALNYYKKFRGNSRENDLEMIEDDVVLIKINRSYKDNMTPEELYEATSVSWVASFEKTEKRDIKYYCSVYQNKIIEVYDFLGSEEELPKRTPSRFILHGKLASEEVRQQLIDLDVGSIHKGSGNPIKYTNFNTLVNINRDIDSKTLISHIHTYLTHKGFLYSQQNIANLYLSLRSKPFVILSGISGTGKTKVVQLFANAVGATQDNGRYQLIPVRPDWSDSSDLLGYTDLKGDFVKGQLTEMVIRASENPQFPHFVVLDEMNLARVEYYLSEFLSVIESRDRQNGKMTTATLVRVDEKEYGLPDNLYIIGTVNMDETTYPFSKKVLDRANSIEFNDIHLTFYGMLTDSADEVSPVNVHNDQFVSQYLYLKEAYPQYQEIIEDVSEKLDEINQQLKLTYAQVGYRVRDEICFYMIYNEEMGLLKKNEAMDFCIMQKILPRISGAGPDVEKLLKALFKKFTGVDYLEEMEVPKTATYPQSAKKVQEMLERLGSQSFTSFWIS